MIASTHCNACFCEGHFTVLGSLQVKYWFVIVKPYLLVANL